MREPHRSRLGVKRSLTALSVSLTGDRSTWTNEASLIRTSVPLTVTGRSNLAYALYFPDQATMASSFIGLIASSITLPLRFNTWPSLRCVAARDTLPSLPSFPTRPPHIDGLVPVSTVPTGTTVSAGNL